MNNTIKIDKGSVLMVAHRGVSGLEKENTVAAFVAAGNRSYFGIETDVHRTADGQFLVIHDDNTARVAIDRLVVEESTFDTLRGITLCDMDGKKGRSDLRIPTLQEYVQVCKRYGKVCVLELKNRFEPEDIRRIVDIIRGEEYLEKVIFISFNLQNMIDLRAMLPSQNLQYLTSKFTDDLIDTLKREKLDVDIYYKALDRKKVLALKAAGITINCWTCDDPDAARDLVKWGVDQITSNILE